MKPAMQDGLSGATLVAVMLKRSPCKTGLAAGPRPTKGEEKVSGTDLDSKSVPDTFLVFGS